jgi:hypothetical protein
MAVDLVDVWVTRFDPALHHIACKSLSILRELTPSGAPGAGRKESSLSLAHSDGRGRPKGFSLSASGGKGRGEVASFNWEMLSESQQHFVRSELTIARYRECRAFIGESRNGIKCVYSPSLADLCQDAFGACVVDEGTKIKGDHTIVATGVRQISAPFRLVLTATPIKNRFPDVFYLAHYVCGGHEGPTARFPYGNLNKTDFSEEFLATCPGKMKPAAASSNSPPRSATSIARGSCSPPSSSAGARTIAANPSSPKSAASCASPWA